MSTPLSAAGDAGRRVATVSGGHLQRLANIARALTNNASRRDARGATRRKQPRVSTRFQPTESGKKTDLRRGALHRRAMSEGRRGFQPTVCRNKTPRVGERRLKTTTAYVAFGSTDECRPH